MRSSLFSARAMTFCTLLATVSVAPRLLAQAGRPQALETRASLISRAENAERSGNRGLAAAIRARLQEGDFQEGDRVVVDFQNAPPATAIREEMLYRPDTLPVRYGKILQFPQAKYPGVPDLNVAGLLRSEIADSVRAHFAVIYKNPTLRVTPLVPLSVTGAVLRGGYIDVAPDLRLTEVFTQAGGLAGDADTRKIVIRRGPQVFMNEKQVQEALDNGLTVDAAQLRGGDQFYVPRKNPSNWLAYAGVAVSVLTLIVAFSRGR